MTIGNRREAPLGQLVRDQEITYGIVQPGSHDPDGVPIIRVGDIRHGTITTTSPLRVSKSVARTHTRTELVGGELLVSLVGTVGETAVVPPVLAGWNVARAVAVMVPYEVTAQWLHYCFQTPAVRNQVISLVNTTVQTTLNLRDLKRVTIPVVEATEIGGITDVLGALDDKIAANAGIAAKADQYLAAEFERSLRVHSVDVVQLSELSIVNAEVVTPIDGGQLRYVDIASVGVGRYEFPAPMAWSDAPSRARRRIRQGDTLWSTVRPNRRSHALNLSKDPLLVGSTGLAVISPRETGYAYLYEATRRPEFVAYLENSAEGTAYPAVSVERMGLAPVPLINKEARDSFESVAAPLRLTVSALAEESRGLCAMRDTLLPHLMSGRLRVRDAEKIVSDHV